MGGRGEPPWPGCGEAPPHRAGNPSLFTTAPQGEGLTGRRDIELQPAFGGGEARQTPTLYRPILMPVGFGRGGAGPMLPDNGLTTRASTILAHCATGTFAQALSISISPSSAWHAHSISKVLLTSPPHVVSSSYSAAPEDVN